MKFKGWDPEKERGTYDTDFYEKHRKYYEGGVTNMATWMREAMDFKSIVDVGCGVGDMLVPLSETHDILGIDFSKGAKEGLVIPEKCYRDHDLTTPLGVVEHRDVVLSLEIWEHIPEEFEATYVANMIAFDPNYIIVSCAAPEQWGRHHYNCKGRDHVIEVMQGHGYEIDDELTAGWQKIKKIATFYRRNTTVFRRSVQADAA